MPGVGDDYKAQVKAATDIVQLIGRTVALRPSPEPLSEEVFAGAVRALKGSFDPEWGGLRGAPKFPQPMALEVLRYMERSRT